MRRRTPLIAAGSSENLHSGVDTRALSIPRMTRGLSLHSLGRSVEPGQC